VHDRENPGEPQIETLGLPAPAARPEMDLKSLALSQDYTSMANVKKAIMKVPILKPTAQTWFQINPDPAWQITVSVIELKEDREHYIVAPAMREELINEWVPKLLTGIITKQGTIMFWPIRLPGQDGKIDTWNESALAIVREYSGRWIRVQSNRESGSYDVIEPISEFPAPEWPADPQAILKIAFRNRIISSADHPIVRQLRGAA
jgi:hypothetical protein